MRAASFLAGALATLAYAAPSGSSVDDLIEGTESLDARVGALSADLAALGQDLPDVSPDAGMPPFFSSLLQAFYLKDQDEAALVDEIEQELRDESAELEKFVAELEGASLQRREEGHAMFEAALEGAAAEWTRAYGEKDGKKDNKKLIGKCVKEANKGKVKTGEKKGDKKDDKTKLVMEGLPRSCCELMQEWHDLEGHAAEVEVVGEGVVEFSL